MIPYEDITLQDARMYWEGAVAFVWHPDQEKVMPYTMELEYPEEGEDEDGHYIENDELFENTTVQLVLHSRSVAYPDRVLSVVGRMMFESPNYIMHRFPVEYVSLEGNHLVRVCLERRHHRAFKGTTLSESRHLPLIDTPCDQATLADSSVLASRNVFTEGGAPEMDDFSSVFWAGVAKVLSIGTPNCMRRNISAPAASINAKQAVVDMFKSSQTVVVPDFSTAIIKHRSIDNLGYVLHRGRMIGTVEYTDGELFFKGTLPASEDRFVKQASRKGQSRLAERLFAHHITWST